MVFVLLQITVVTFLPFNLQIADIKQLANTLAVIILKLYPSTHLLILIPLVRSYILVMKSQSYKITSTLKSSAKWY